MNLKNNNEKCKIIKLNKKSHTVMVIAVTLDPFQKVITASFGMTLYQ